MTDPVVVKKKIHYRDLNKNFPFTLKLGVNFWSLTSTLICTYGTSSRTNSSFIEPNLVVFSFRKRLIIKRLVCIKASNSVFFKLIPGQ